MCRLSLRAATITILDSRSLGKQHLSQLLNLNNGSCRPAYDSKGTHAMLVAHQLSSPVPLQAGSATLCSVRP